MLVRHAVLNQIGLFDERLWLFFNDVDLSLRIKQAGWKTRFLADVPYMDSSGVASLVKLLSRARKSGSELALANLNDRVRSVFEITRLDSVFRICGSEEEALA